MARLPVPGADDHEWGEILNEYLLVSLNEDGTPRDHVTPDMFVGDVDVEKEGWSKPIHAAFQSGRAVFLPPGEYPILETIHVPAGAYFYGQGKKSVLRAARDAIVMLRIGEPTAAKPAVVDVVVRDLSFHGGGGIAVQDDKPAVANVTGVQISNAKNVRLEGLFVHDMGIKTDSLDDGATGGWGIQVTSEFGPAHDVIITRCFVARIAGSGNMRGDGIQVTHHHNPGRGESPDENAPDRICISHCHVEHVGRHCFCFDGAHATPVRRVTLHHCTGRQALLCGIDLEEACDLMISDVRLSQCGVKNAFGDPDLLYEARYGLRSGITYGHLSHRNTFRNIEIEDCPIGMGCGAGNDNLLDRVVVRRSLWRDIAMVGSRVGAAMTLVDCRFETRSPQVRELTDETGWPWLYHRAEQTLQSDMTFTRCRFEMHVPVSAVIGVTFRDCVFRNTVEVGVKTGYCCEDVRFDGCEFASLVLLSGVDGCTFQNSTFSSPVETSSPNRNLRFAGCRFKHEGALFFRQNHLCEHVRIEGCEFRPANLSDPSIKKWWGISAEYRSLRNASVVGNVFIATYRAIRHLDANDEVGFSDISRNHFVDCDFAIHLCRTPCYLTIADNTFTGIKGDCIAFYDVTETSMLRGCVVRGNRAIGPNKSAGGIKVYLGSAGWHYCAVQDNVMREWVSDSETTPANAYDLPPAGAYGLVTRNY